MPPVTGDLPDYPARTVVRNQSTERELSMMRWGMPPPPKFGGLPLTNIRNSSSPHWGPSGGSLDRYCHRPTVADDAPTMGALQGSKVGGITDFIALDVETANADFGSICSIGLVHFRGGTVFKSLTILRDPEDDFDPINVKIHGLRPKMLPVNRRWQRSFRLLVRH